MPDALAELLAELEQTDDEATIEIAAQALAEGNTSRERLGRLSEHRLPAIRRAATLALGQRSDPKARGLLEDRLEDPDPQVRRAACTALAALADDASVAPMSQLLEDRLGSVRSAAAEALGAFSGQRVVGLLEKLLEGERSLSPRRAAVESLFRLGDGGASEEGRAPVDGDGDDDVKQRVLQILICHVPREDDPELSLLATEYVIALAGGVTADELLEVVRSVPRSGRQRLADAFRGSPVPLPKPLARLAGQLGHLASDPEVLNAFGADLTARASQQGSTPLAHGREEELKAIFDRLHRPGQKSLVLVGPSGVGKTAIVSELARRLANEPVLVPTLLHEATTGEVLSGTRYLGEWQTRLKQLQDAIKAPHRAIWYLPDINRLVDAGTSEHSDESFATMLAPALERGDLTIVGESTQEALRRGLDHHPRISKLFQKIHVEPPTPARSVELLQDVADDLVREHATRGIELVMPTGVVQEAQELADDYLSVQARPGNGISLLTEAINAAVQEGEDAAASWGESDPKPRRVEIPTRRVLETLSTLTGVPLELLDDNVSLNLDDVRSFFANRVLGQDEAVETVVDLIGLIKSGLTDPSRPLGVLFFVGPTGVGKTEMAKALAEYIFGSRDRLVRVDLGEFRDPISLRRLVGDPLAPERAARSGLLTAPVRERPFSVVLLDELEKAHQNVFDLLLPLMDEGRLVDEQGRVTDFRRTIVVMTSNLGSDLTEDAWLGFSGKTPEDDARGEKVQRALEEHFRPEFLNRLSKTVVFLPLSLEVMRRLTRREVRRVLARRGITRRNAIVETDDSVIGILLREGFSSRYGARPLKRRIEQLLLRPLSRAILRLRPDDEQALVRLSVRDDRLVSDVVVERSSSEEEESLPSSRRATARIKDPRRGRLVSLDDLEERVLELSEEIEAIEAFLEREQLRERKASLLNETQETEFWKDKARARAVLSDIAALERTLETPRHLQERISRLDRLFERARRQSGESRLLHDLLVKIEELAHKIEFTNYTLRCPSAVDRGEAYISLRRVDDNKFPKDVIQSLVEMYIKYVKSKGFGFRVIYEALSPSGRVREAGFRVEGLCAFGLLKGEAGLHQWISRVSGQRKKKLAFVRVSVVPPAESPLRLAEVTRERRSSQRAGVLLRRHRQHLVLTHLSTMVAIDGSVGGGPEDDEDAMLFLAARVGSAGGSGEEDPGLVRKYVLSHQPMVRDMFTDQKEHLDPVLDGQLDPFVLPRIMKD